MSLDIQMTKSGKKVYINSGAVIESVMDSKQYWMRLKPGERRCEDGAVQAELKQGKSVPEIKT